MKKIISVVMAAVMAVALFGCADAGKKSKHKKDNSKYNGPSIHKAIDPEDLKDTKGPMLVVECHVLEWEYTETFSVDYSGDTCMPYNYYGMQMNDEDLMYLYEFCQYAAANDPFADYSEDVCDGATYTFTFYDPDGESHELYHGYCYDNDELQNVLDVITRYEVELVFDDYCE